MHRQKLRVSIIFVLAALLATLAVPTSYVFAAADSLAASDSTGTIRIRYSKEGATYHAYRLFDVVTLEEVKRSSAQGTRMEFERNGADYGYAIAKTYREAGTTRANAWWEFLLTQGPDGANSATPYAVLTNDTDEHKLEEAYFLIDPNSLDFDGSEYHELVITKKFMNAHKVDTSKYAQTAPDQTIGGTTDTVDAPASRQVQIVRDFAQAALSWADSHQLNNYSGHYVATDREASDAQTYDANTRADIYHYTGDDAIVEDLPLGYYLLSTATGALCSLDGPDSVAYVYDKNQTPELFVQVRAKGGVASNLPYAQQSVEEQRDLLWSESNLRNWAYKTDASPGDYVQFKTVIIAMQGVEDYTLHDVMEPGLTFVDDPQSSESTGLYDDTGLQRDGAFDYSPRVYLYSQSNASTYDIPSKVGKFTNWGVQTSKGGSSLNDGCDFHITFGDVGTSGDQKQTFAYEVTGETANDGNPVIKTVDVGDWDRIVVTYWARVNEDAVAFGSDKTSEEVAITDDLTNIRDSEVANAQLLTVQAHTISDANERNTNNVVLTYGNASHTTWARAEVTTYQFDVVRVAVPEETDDDSSALPLLAGAQYIMYRDLGQATPKSASFSVQIGEKHEVHYYDPNDALSFELRHGSYWLVRSGEEDAAGKSNSHATRLVTTTDGALNVSGLKAGAYVLVEDVTPEGSAGQGRPVAVTVHGEPYTNTDIVEDNTPGLRHSNDEGDLTVTTQVDDTVRSDVYPWKAVTEGKPATYKRTYVLSNASKSIRNGGVLITGGAAAGVASVGNMGIAFGIALVITIVTVAVVFMRRRER